MKICVVIHSADDKEQLAGVRIRYRRLEHDLLGKGHTLDIIAIQELSEPEKMAHDIYIISKCYDVRSHLAAVILKDAGKSVGVDLFDDYFSQVYDSRLGRFRHWIKVLLKNIDFILCSTLAMKDVVRDLVTDVPIHVLNDPWVPTPISELKKSINEKQDYFRSTGLIDIAWFGIGDNPYFPVGLEDLVTCTDELVKFSDRGHNVRLHILTNRRALTPDAMAMLTRLPVPYTIDGWSLEKESALLKKCIVCLLPVNAQNFSIVKSLNRAITALSAGVQVISTGYPLYESLNPFIYYDVPVFMDDLEKQLLLLRATTVSDFHELMNINANPHAEVEKLLDFLDSVIVRTRKSYRQLSVNKTEYAIIYGKESTEDIREFSRKVGAITISSPFCKQNAKCDIQFIYDEKSIQIEMYVAESFASTKLPVVNMLSFRDRQIDNMTYRKIDLESIDCPIDFGAVMSSSDDSPMCLVASHAIIIQKIIAIIESFFPGIRCYESELTRLPVFID